MPWLPQPALTRRDVRLPAVPRKALADLRLDKIRLFNAVNIEQGYKPVSIYSPREVISYGQED